MALGAGSKMRGGWEGTGRRERLFSLTWQGTKRQRQWGRPAGKRPRGAPRGVPRPTSTRNRIPGERKERKKLAPQLKQARVWTKARNCLMTGSKTAGAIVST